MSEGLSTCKARNLDPPPRRAGPHAMLTGRAVAGSAGPGAYPLGSQLPQTLQTAGPGVGPPGSTERRHRQHRLSLRARNPLRLWRPKPFRRGRGPWALSWTTRSLWNVTDIPSTATPGAETAAPAPVPQDRLLTFSLLLMTFVTHRSS